MGINAPVPARASPMPDWLTLALNRHLARDTRLRYLPASSGGARRGVCVELTRTALCAVASGGAGSRCICLNDTDIRPSVSQELFFRGLATLLCAPSFFHSWRPARDRCGYSFRCRDSVYAFRGVPAVPGRFQIGRAHV